MNYLCFSNSHYKVVYSFRMMLVKNMDHFHRNLMNHKIIYLHHNNNSSNSSCMKKVGMDNRIKMNLDQI